MSKFEIFAIHLNNLKTTFNWKIFAFNDLKKKLIFSNHFFSQVKILCVNVNDLGSHNYGDQDILHGILNV